MKRHRDPISGRSMATGLIEGRAWQAVGYGDRVQVGMEMSDGTMVTFVEPCSLDEFITRMEDKWDNYKSDMKD